MMPWTFVILVSPSWNLNSLLPNSQIFAIHGVGGIIGNILTGIFAQASVARFDGFTIIRGGLLDRHSVQFGYQLADSLAGLGYAFVVTVRFASAHVSILSELLRSRPLSCGLCMSYQACVFAQTKPPKRQAWTPSRWTSLSVTIVMIPRPVLNPALFQWPLWPMGFRNKVLHLTLFFMYKGSKYPSCYITLLVKTHNCVGMLYMPNTVQIMGIPANVAWCWYKWCSAMWCKLCFEICNTNTTASTSNYCERIINMHYRMCCGLMSQDITSEII